MTAQSLAEATGLYGFAVSLLVAKDWGLDAKKVLDVGQFMQSHPRAAMVYLWTAEGFTQEEIAYGLGVNQSTVCRIIQRDLVSMVSLLHPGVVVG